MARPRSCDYKPAVWHPPPHLSSRQANWTEPVACISTVFYCLFQSSSGWSFSYILTLIPASFSIKALFLLSYLTDLFRVRDVYKGLWEGWGFNHGDPNNFPDPVSLSGQVEGGWFEDRRNILDQLGDHRGPKWGRQESGWQHGVMSEFNQQHWLWSWKASLREGMWHLQNLNQ